MTVSAILIGKILLVLVILGAMVFILLGISHIFKNDDLNTTEDDDLLRKDIEEDENVISNKSVFYNFLVKTTRFLDEEEKDTEE